MASGNVVVFLSGHGLSLDEPERCMDLRERLKATLKIFEECRREFHERGFSVVISGGVVYPGWKRAVSKIIRDLLVEQGIPEHCLCVEEFSWDIETGVSNAWKYHVKGLMKSLKNPTVHIVSQSLDAYMTQQMLREVSNGVCRAIVRACPYASWRTFLAGAWRFACYRAEISAIQALHIWKQPNVHRS